MERVDGKWEDLIVQMNNFVEEIKSDIENIKVSTSTDGKCIIPVALTTSSVTSNELKTFSTPVKTETTTSPKSSKNPETARTEQDRPKTVLETPSRKHPNGNILFSCEKKFSQFPCSDLS